MNNYRRCEICGKSVFRDSHTCKPLFYFRHGDWGEDWNEVRGYDHEDAALEFAQKYNEEEYALMNSEEDVEIKDSTGLIKLFSVSAEPDVNYSAIELKWLK